MSERAQSMDDATMKFGLLMESAQAHQKSAENQLERLRAHTRRPRRRGARRDSAHLVEELQMLTAESTRAADALQKMQARGASARGTLWSLLMARTLRRHSHRRRALGAAIGAEIAALRARRDELAASVANFEQHGGRIDWRRCGAMLRACACASTAGRRRTAKRRTTTWSRGTESWSGRRSLQAGASNMYAVSVAAAAMLALTGVLGAVARENRETRTSAACC